MNTNNNNKNTSQDNCVNNNMNNYCGNNSMNCSNVKYITNYYCCNCSNNWRNTNSNNSNTNSNNSNSSNSKSNNSNNINTNSNNSSNSSSKSNSINSNSINSNSNTNSNNINSKSNNQPLKKARNPSKSFWARPLLATVEWSKSLLKKSSPRPPKFRELNRQRCKLKRLQLRSATNFSPFWATFKAKGKSLRTTCIHTQQGVIYLFWASFLRTFRATFWAHQVPLPLWKPPGGDKICMQAIDST